MVVVSKKSLGGLGAVLLTTMLSCGSYAEDAKHLSNFSGAYVGAVLGYSFNETKYNSVLNGNRVHGKNPKFEDPEFGIIGGWGKTFETSKLYLGLELACLMLGSSEGFKDSNGKLTNEIAKKATFEAALRMGMSFGRYLPYAKVGYANTRFNLNTKVPGSVANTDDPVVVGKHLGGFLAGCGLDVNVSEKIAAGIGYTYIDYEKKSARFSGDGTNPASPTNYLDLKHEPTSHNVMLRLTYRF